MGNRSLDVHREVDSRLPVNLRLKGKQDRQQKGHDKSPKKSKIRRKNTTRKRIKSTIKIRSRTSCTRHRNAGRPALHRDLAPTPTPTPALSPLHDLTLHLSLMCEPLVDPSIEG